MKLPSFFRIRLLFWRAILAIRALPYLKTASLVKAHLFLFYSCSLGRALRLLDRETNPYGETPYSTLDKIAHRFNITSKDRVYDLGSGRGLGVTWWATQVGCVAYGVDNSSYFVDLSKKMQEYCSLVGVDFIEADFLEVDLSQATVIYLYGTSLNDEMILLLIERFKDLGSHVKIITVSYPLSEYSSAFRTVAQFKGTFHWGTTDIYLNDYHK